VLTGLGADKGRAEGWITAALAELAAREESAV
jgi:hypothetical protein